MEYREISVSVPELTLARVDLHFYDPAIGRPIYGARSQLITKLLEEWLDKEMRNEQRTHATTSDQPKSSSDPG